MAHTYHVPGVQVLCILALLSVVWYSHGMGSDGNADHAQVGKAKGHARVQLPPGLQAVAGWCSPGDGLTVFP